MPVPSFSIRATTSVLLLVITLVLGYFAMQPETSYDGLTAFAAWSPALLFVALGPAAWLQDILFDIPIKTSYYEWSSLGNSEKHAYLHWVFGIARLLLMSAGVAILLITVYRVAQ